MSLERTYQKVTFQDSRAELVDVRLPELADDEVLIQARCSLISPGTERAALKRLWDDAEFRASPGYALAGDVRAVGKDVQELAVGDRVISLMNHAGLAVAPAAPWMTLKIPAQVDYEASTFVVLASVALHAIRRAQMAFGETFTIIGAGIIGLIATQLAKMGGAQQVIMLDYADNRLALARSYGADLTVNPAREDPIRAVFRATGGKGASLILEATGNPQVIPEAFKLAAEGGRIITVGALEEPVAISFHKEFIRRELSLIAAFQPFCPKQENLYWQWTQQANRLLLLGLLAEEKLRVKEMLTHRFPAQSAPQVYEQIKAGNPEMLGVLLEWNLD